MATKDVTITEEFGCTGYTTDAISTDTTYPLTNITGKAGGDSTKAYIRPSGTQGEVYLTFSINFAHTVKKINSVTCKINWAVGGAVRRELQLHTGNETGTLYYSATATSNPTASTSLSLQTLSNGSISWTTDKIKNIKFRIKLWSSYDYGAATAYVQGASVIVNYTYTQTYWTVTPSIQSNSDRITISPTSAVQINDGNSYTFSFTSSVKPKVQDVTSSGTTTLTLSGSSPNWKYVMSNVKVDHTLKIYPPWKITASKNPTDSPFSISTTSAWVTPDNSFTLTITNATSRPKIKDNNADAVTTNTSSTNNTWTYTLSKVTADHTIVVSPGTTIWYKNSAGNWVKGSKLYIKTSSGWKPATHIYIKTSSTAWTQKL